MSPAGATILGQMLVTNRSKEVSTIDVLPFPSFRQVCWDEWLVDSWISSVWISDAAGGSDGVIFTSEGNSDYGCESERFH
jgi:hypothetical protein